ncbi:transcription factor HES-1-B-like [Lineus longissimus]|uniref:transcription factor HES-1-B-like n=1 Tax=Lineus longissimus TaxID=88925 RepID=UPI00315D6966
MDRFYGQKQLLRKINKPLVEKRRRARINSSLQQLKTLVVESINKTSSPKAKLEKADILEMTVRYIRNMQRQQYAAASSDPKVVNKYKAGFKACMSEVDGFFGSIDINPDVKSRVLDHLKSSAEAGASPEPKEKRDPEEEPETSKAPLKTLQVRDMQKPKSVACKKLMMQSLEVPSTPVSSVKSVVSELAPVSSKRVAPAAACGKASDTIYTSPNVPMKQMNYQAQDVPVSRAQSSTSSRPAPYHVPARQQNQGLSYRVTNPRNLAQQQNNTVSMYAQIAPRPQNVQANRHIQNIAQQAPNFAQQAQGFLQQAPAPESQMWRPW